MKTILIVEDERRMREILIAYFEKEDFRVFEAEDGEEALELFETEKIDLILLDIMMPKIDGYQVAESIRKRSDVPMIMITAKSEEADKIQGFRLGVDDYVTKPFSPKVLVAKSINLLKRVEGTIGSKEGTLSLGCVSVNTISFEVQVDGEPITLAPKEYELLLYLMRNKNKVLSRDMILNHVWGFDYYGDLRTVDTHIKKLRKKMGDASDYIKTVIRAGYKFEVDEG